MIRFIVETLVPFFAPFVIYAVWRKFAGDAADPEHWTKRTMSLAVMGLILTALTFIVSGLVAERHGGGYEPAHLENGILVPGQFK